MAVPGEQMLKSLSSSSTIGSDEDHKVYCQPCDRDGPRLPAHGYCVDCREHLCDTCFTAHKRHTLSMHHTLLDKTSMPQTISSDSIHQSQPDNLTKPCPRHMKETLMFYCPNHKALLCIVCVTLEHTVTSCKVGYIPDISDQILDSKEYEDILKAIDTITEQCREKLENWQKITALSNSSLTDVLADIKKFRKEINQRLDELERQAEDATKTIQKENNINLKTVETCNDVTKSLKASSDVIKNLNTSKKADKLFMELKLAEQMINDYEKHAQQLAQYDVKEYNFKPNKAISTLLDKERSLGTVTDLLSKQPSHSPAVDIKSRQTSHQSKICIKTSKDHRDTCLITGMTLLTPGLLIITDKENKAVKMVDTCSQSVTDQLQLGAYVHDITSVSSTELAVTLTLNHNIQFISVSSNKLKKKQTLKVDGRCLGISCCQGKLVVSFVVPVKLQILDRSGTILTTVRGDNIFRTPFYVTTNTSSIYVSDRKMKTVTRLNWTGEVIGSYCGMTDPFGITVSDDGTVFMCDRQGNVIEEIACDFSSGKVVLKGFNYPFAVCWCAETSKLYFSCVSSQDKHDNFLQVLKLT